VCGDELGGRADRGDDAVAPQHRAIVDLLPATAVGGIDDNGAAGMEG
jgi:hypothetical protein